MFFNFCNLRKTFLSFVELLVKYFGNEQVETGY